MRPPAIPPPVCGAARTAAEDAVRTLLAYVGADTESADVRETPGRYVRALLDLTAGYREDPAVILGKRFERGAYDQVIVLRGVEYTSLCEHHVIPFTGSVSLAYLPGADGRIVGLSKLARLVQCFARRLQVQERMTQEIGDALYSHTGAIGAAVRVEGRHGCMSARGVRCSGTFITSYMAGVFRDDASARSEVLSLLRP